MSSVPERTVVTAVRTKTPTSVASTGTPETWAAPMLEPMPRTCTPKGVQRYTAYASRNTIAVSAMGNGTPSSSPEVKYFTSKLA